MKKKLQAQSSFHNSETKISPVKTGRKQRNYKLILLFCALLSGAGLSVNGQCQTAKIYTRVHDTDPGDNGSLMGTPWNNLTGPTTAGLKDELGNTTAVGLSFISNPTFWHPYTGGPVTGNNSGIYPDPVLHEFYYFGYSGYFPAPETVDVSVTGLNPGQTYTLTFYAGSDFVDNTITIQNTGTTTYTIGANTVSLDVFDNRTNTVFLSNLSPDVNGTITFTMAKGPNTSIGFLNALIITPEVSGGGCCTPPNITAPTVTQPTCATATGTIVVNATGGSTLEYSVDNGTSWQSSNTFNTLPVSSYTIKVRLQSSPTCSTAYSLNPVVLAAATGCCTPPNITAPTVTQPTCATATGTIVVNATGGSTLEYQLNSGAFQLSNTFSNLTPGNYSITVRLQNSITCSSTYISNPVVLNAATGCCVAPVITAPTVTQPTCATPTGTIVVNATGGSTLEYQLNSGAFQLSNTFSGLAAGNYNITVRLQNSITCSSTYSSNPVVINAVPVAPTVNAPTVTQPTCAVPTGTIVVNATGSGTLEYSKDNGTNWQPSATFSGLAPGSSNTIKVRLASSTTCSTSYSANPVVINAVPVAPTVNAPTVTQPTCAVPTGTIVVNATGSGTLEYSKDDGTSWQPSATFSGLAPGSSNNIKVRLASSTTCITAYSSNPVVINAVPVAPTVNAPTVTQPTCATATGTIVVNATGSGALEYSINNGSNWFSSATFSGLATGSYNIVVRLQNNITCSSAYSSNPVVLTAATGCCVTPVITAPTVTQPTCAIPTGTIVVNATGSGALEYSINSGSNWFTSTTFSGLAAGSYNIQVRLQASPTCIATYTSNPVLINAAPALPVISAPTITQPTCAVPTGTIVVNATGSGALEYSKDNGTNWQSSATFSGLAPGSSNNIKVRLASSMTCIATYSSNPVVINAVPALPVITTPTVTQPTCAVSTGTIVVNATGSGTLEYALNNGAYQTSTTFSGLAVGSYNITARLQSSPTCIATYSSNPVILTAATGCCVAPVITAPTVTQPTCAVPTGTIVVNATGSGALEYRLDNGTNWQSLATFSGLTPGSYNITVRLQSSPTCLSTYISNPVVINAVPALPVITDPTVTHPTCAVPTGTIVVNATGSGALEYSVTAGSQWQSSATFSGLQQNVAYQIKVRLASSPTCIAIYSGNSVQINSIPTFPVVNAPVVTQPTCAVPTGTIVVNTTGSGSGPLEYSVDNGSTWSGSATFSSLAPGSYNIQVRRQNSPTCITAYSSNPVVLVAATPVITAPTVTQSTCAVLTGTIVVNATGSGTLEYSKDNGTSWQTSNTFTPLATGSYNIKVRLQSSPTCITTYANNPVVLTAANCSGKSIPGKIEAEAWDAKSGPQYAVPTNDAGGGQQVIGIANGSWLDYNVNVTQTGTYTVNFRVATSQNNAQFQVKLGNTVLGTINIPNTGGWDVWQTIGLTNVALTAGTKTIRIQSTNNESCNFNWMDWVVSGTNTSPSADAGQNQIITLPISQAILTGIGTPGNGGSIISYGWTRVTKPVNASEPTIQPANTAGTTVSGLVQGTYTFRLTVTQNDNQTATSDVTITVNPSSGKIIAGRVEAESFDTKSGGMYAVATTDVGGGQQVIGITNGSWMDYNVNVTQTGAYTVGFRVATSQLHAQFQIKLGANILATVNIPNTGSWDTWLTVPVTNVPLTAGAQTLRIQSSNSESCNFNWMDWVLEGPNTAPTANAGQPQSIVLPVSQASLTGSGTAGNGGSITYAWTRITKPANAPEPTIQPANTAGTTVSGLVQGTYVFRLTVTQNDNQTATSDVTITVNPVSVPGTKVVNVNLYANNDPYVNTQWNNQLITQPSYPFTSGTYNYADGSVSGIFSTMSSTEAPTTTTYGDNGTGYVTTMCPQAVGRYTSYFTGTRTVTIKGLDNSKLYDIQLYCSRVTNQGTTRNTINGVNVDINVFGNLDNAASFTNIIPVGGQIVLTQTPLNTFVYLNGFTITEKSGGTQPVVNAGPPQIITLPTNTVTLAGSVVPSSGGTVQTHTWSKFSGGTASITDPSNYNTTVTGLSAGTYIFRLTVLQTDNQTAFSDVTVTVNPASGKLIPGRVEAESWDTKSGGMYAVATSDAGGGQHVVGITNGSWMDYNVTVAQTGTYTVNFRVATTQLHAQFQVKLGAAVLGTINIPSTGGWDNWQTFALNNIALAAGAQTIRIQSSNNESCNFNWMDWTLNAPPVAPVTIAATKLPAETEITENSKMAVSVFPNPASSYFNLKVQSKSTEAVMIKVFDITGRPVQQLQGVPGQALKFGDKITNGTYFVEVKQGSEKSIIKVIKQ